MQHFLSILLMTTALLLSSCTGNSQQPAAAANYHLEAVSFAEKMNELPTAAVVDVRTPDEFANGHLRNARNIDWNSTEFDHSISQLDKDKPVLVYCLSGGRSASAAAKMRSVGFKEVYEMNGGIMKWRAANLPEENPNSGGMTAADFEALLNTDKKVLIDFYADWCGPCKKMAPFLETMKTEMADSVVIVRINADTHQAIAKQLNVDALPTLLLYKNKQSTWRYTGYMNQDELTTAIAQH